MGLLGTGYAASKVLGVEAKPIALPNEALCETTSIVGEGTEANPVECSYQCAGFAELIVIILPPGMTRCPGGDKRVARWGNIRGYHRLRP